MGRVQDSNRNDAGSSPKGYRITQGHGQLQPGLAPEGMTEIVKSFLEIARGLFVGFSIQEVKLNSRAGPIGTTI